MTRDDVVAGARRPSAGGVATRGPFLRLGLPRDPAASTHVAGFLVATVVTVLLTRGLLAATGYPQLGGDGLHIAHVLWGGLLMALAFLLLLSFAGPVVRPLGAVVGGAGFGLFVDEIGKFVTSDNDYFYEPTAALIYLVVVLLVLVAEALHGRRPHHASEHLAAAADHAVAGLAGGFTPHAREVAHEQLRRGADAPGHAAVSALLDAVEDDPHEVPNLVDRVGSAVVRTTRRLVRARHVPLVTVALLVLTSAATIARGVHAWLGGADVPGWVVVALLASGAASTVVALWGLAVVRGRRAAGYRLFRRAVLISLLVTQVFLFRIEEWAATAGLLADLVVLGLVAAELAQMAEAERDQD